jgi:capsular polysaccharide biosynthesis protein
MKFYHKLPYNIKEEDFILFENIRKEKVYKTKLFNLKNVFISHQGLILKFGLLLNRCAFNLTGRKDLSHYFPFWKDTLEKYLVCKFGKSLKVEKLDHERYFIIHTKWFNYGFWVNDSLNRLILVEEKTGFDNVVLLLPEELKLYPFVLESLNAFDVSIKFIKTDTHLIIKDLFYPQVRKWTASFNSVDVNRVRNRIQNEIKNRIPNNPLKVLKSNIYLTRNKRGVRTIENETQIIEILIKYNFKILTFEELSFWEQAEVMMNAKNFISIHGAGFSNIIFMNKYSKVFELMEHDFARYGNPFPHWKLANCLDLEYYYQFCKSDDTSFIEPVSILKAKKNVRMSLVNRNIYVDINEFEKNVLKMLND